MLPTERKTSDFWRKRWLAFSNNVWRHPMLVVGLRRVSWWVSSWVFYFSVVVLLGVCSGLFDIWVFGQRSWQEENPLICAKCIKTFEEFKVTKLEASFNRFYLNVWMSELVRFEKDMKWLQKLCGALIVIDVNCVLGLLFNYRVFGVYWTIVFRIQLCHLFRGI